MPKYPYSRKCRQCQEYFSATSPNDHFCSIECKFAHKMADYFPDGTPPETDCWEWPGGRNKLGYGRFRYTKARKLGAHRVAAIVKFGPIPPSVCVMHRCDNPACVNPAHLELGTVALNNKDRAKKGRNRDQCGEKHNNAKLTETSVKFIRNAADPPAALADRYGVSVGTIYDILARRTWGHI